MSGSYSDLNAPFWCHTGSALEPDIWVPVVMPVGITIERVGEAHNIVVCSFCKSHNAVSNPVCERCGAPLGRSSERVYG